MASKLWFIWSLRQPSPSVSMSSRCCFFFVIGASLPILHEDPQKKLSMEAPEGNTAPRVLGGSLTSPIAALCKVHLHIAGLVSGLSEGHWVLHECESTKGSWCRGMWDLHIFRPSRKSSTACKRHGNLHCRFRNLLYRVWGPQNSYASGFQTLEVSKRAWLRLSGSCSRSYGPSELFRALYVHVCVCV